METFKKIAIVVATGLIFSFTTNRQGKENASVSASNAVYLFHYSTPTSKYTTLGTYAPTFAKNDKSETLKEKIVRKVKEKYPNANGIIFADDMQSGTAILLLD